MFNSDGELPVPINALDPFKSCIVHQFIVHIQHFSLKGKKLALSLNQQREIPREDFVALEKLLHVVRKRALRRERQLEKGTVQLSAF